MHTQACPRGLNESTGRACRAIEYTAHQARVGPSRLLTRAEGNETIREHFATHLRTDLDALERRPRPRSRRVCPHYVQYKQYRDVLLNSRSQSEIWLLPSP